MNYTKDFNTKTTNVQNKVPNKKMILNHTNGYVFKTDDMNRLKRFLILGTDKNTYYEIKEKQTTDSAEFIVNLINFGKGKEVLDMAIEVSTKGLARKNEPAIFVLALCLSFGDILTKQYAIDNANKILRIGTHLFQFAQNIKSLRGWGNSVKKIFRNWYLTKSIKDLTFQIIKYQQRNTDEGVNSSIWSHRDLLRLNHIKPDTEERNILFNYITKKEINNFTDNLKQIQGFELIKTETNKNKVINLITDYSLTEEMIPSTWKSNKEIQEVLLPNLGMTAIIRSLGKFSTSGLLDQYNLKQVNFITDKLTNKEQIKKSKLHPLQILDAIKVYNLGHGVKGNLTWKINPKISEALENAFYLSFDNVVPTNKNIVLALDVSGSMTNCNIKNSLLSPREISACIALITMKTEKNWIIKGFSDNYIDLNINPNMSLENVIKYINSLSFGSTNCSLPMKDALKNKADIDAFVIFTDNEVNSGTHPFQALNNYRKIMNKPNTKLIVNAMTVTNFSIANPNDKNMLDIVGASTDTPKLISDFIRGDI